MNTFIGIIILIVSILQIILFFKIWQMTNDAARIKEAAGSIKVTLERLLYSKIPEEKRMHFAFAEVLEMLWSQNAIKINELPSSEPKRTEELKKQIRNIFDLNKRMFNKVLEKNVVSDVYNIEKLKEEILNQYQKKIAEVLESSK